MKNIIREVDKEKGILQVTTQDERWYLKKATNEAGLRFPQKYETMSIGKLKKDILGSRSALIQLIKVNK